MSIRAAAQAGMASETGIQAKALLFDMDGVLVSSVASVVRCWRQWCQIYGVPNADTFEVPHGTRAADVIRMMKPEFDEAQVAEALRVIEDLEVADTDGITVLPGAKALLDQLPLERWAIVTSSTHRLLLVRLAAAGLPVPERLISADMVQRGKPDPEPYLLGAKMLGFAPEDCIVVEDAPSGVDAGVAAGCRVLGVIGTHVGSELAQATWIVGSLEHVKVRMVEHGMDVQVTPISEGSPQAHS